MPDGCGPLLDAGFTIDGELPVCWKHFPGLHRTRDEIRVIGGA